MDYCEIGDHLQNSVQLDADNCLSLASILRALKSALTEEQAWALCHQTLKCIRAVGQQAQYYLISDAKYLFIHKDGTVHEKTLTFTDGFRKSAPCVKWVLSSFGITLFKALDYEIPEDEERVLDLSLEQLIEKLAVSDQLTSIVECKEDSDFELDLKDEGIERDSLEDENDENFNLVKFVTEDVMKMCVFRLKYAEEANYHYKKVCHLLISEALELANCMERILKGTKELRKSFVFIEQNEERQKMVKDVHSLTLELIKSRPKLTPVSRRKLPPAPTKQQTPHEKLMNSIRENHKLRPTQWNFCRKPLLKLETGDPTKTMQRNDTPCPQRRLIKPNLTLSLSISSEDEEEESIVDISLSDKCIETANQNQSCAQQSQKSGPEPHPVDKKPLRKRFTEFLKYFQRSPQYSHQ